MGEEDELHLNNGIANKKISTIALVLIDIKFSITILVLIEMTIKMTLMLTMMTWTMLTMIQKEMNSFRITTISYLKIIAVLIVV